MTTKRITEQFRMNTGVRVDRAAGTISGVRICGEKSANGRRYPRKVFENSPAKYDGVDSYHGHRERKFENLAAKVTQTGNDTDGFPRCTLQVILSDPYANKLLEMAETNPEKIGLSHVAECKSHFEGGIEVIDEIVKVEAVDIVLDPATNPRGFAESTGDKPVKITFSKFVEAVGPKLNLKRLLAAKTLSEMDGVGDMEVNPPADDAAGDSCMADALCQLIAAISKDFTDGNLSADEAGAKVVAFLKAHAGETDAVEPDADETPAESKKRKKGEPKPLTEATIAAIVAKEIAKLAKPVETVKTEAEKPESGAKPKAESKAAPLPESDDDLVKLLKS